MLNVYKTCYNLKAQPFKLSPDHHFSFGHRSYDDAKAYLKYAVSEGEGFVVITGEPGTGKTTLIAALMSELDMSRVKIATLTNAQLESDNLVSRVAGSFGLHVDSDARISALAVLEQFLVKQNQSEQRAILIVDEAQGLSMSALEKIRLLSNLQHNSRLLLQVFLVGQEPLLDMIRQPGMEQLHQRLIAASRLVPLELDETISYIGHRLNQVGWRNDPAFTEEAMSLIHKFSEGVPRRINLICHRLFLHGALKQLHEFAGEDALHVVVELHKEGLLTPVVRRAMSEVKKSGNLRVITGK